MIMGGKVRNGVSQESLFTIDMRSGGQEEILKAQKKIRGICQKVAAETGVRWEIPFDDRSGASQIPAVRDSVLVQTILDVLRYLEIENIERIRWVRQKPVWTSRGEF
jgi:metal-dependent amidase/aminoacylase/carboxypeptidase family protein